MDLRALFDELKRRRVLRVAGVYVLAAWAAIEGAATIFPLLGLPQWAPTLVLALCLVGCPVVLGLAWAFDVTSDGIRRTAPVTEVPPSRRRALVVAATGVLLLTAGGWAVWLRPGEEPRPLDPQLVAVFPFRVSADASLGYLREGVVDLMATKLTGGVGPRALDARAAMSAWREAAGSAEGELETTEALRLARRLGAGQLLLGSVVGSPGDLTLNGTLYDVATGEVRVRADGIRGAPEDVAGLVDRLAGQLLASEAGAASHQLAALTSTSFPALKLYLEGRQLYRVGRWREGAAKLDEAIVLDSTFTLAAMEYREGSGWGDLTTDNARSDEILALAHRHAHRLSDKDRAYYEAFLAPIERPEERLAAWERVVRLAPEKPEGWYHLGVWHAHTGLLTGRSGSIAAARSALDRALELDPTYATAVEYRLRLAVHESDMETFRRVGERYIADAGEGEHVEYLRWFLAAGTGDQAELDRIRAGMDSLSVTALGVIVGASRTFGLETRDAERALSILERRATTEAERYNHGWRAAFLYGDQGRYGEMAVLMDGAFRGADPDSAPFWRVYRKLTSGGDTVGLGRAARQLEGSLDWPPEEDEDPGLATRTRSCGAALGRIATGEPAAAEAHLDGLSAPYGEERSVQLRPQDARCAAAVRALAASLRGDGEAAVRHALALDSLLLANPGWPRAWRNFLQIQCARVLAEHGRPEEALAALRRRELINPADELAVMLRDEGRLAAQLGDTEGAIRAWSHYLRLRTKPDPELVPEVEEVRRELAALGGERRKS